MEKLGLNEIRERFLSFFESKGHLRKPSFSLIPSGDASLLLINSGMAPLKPYFSGEVTPPRNRMTTCQKCIRTPDIERVGKTSRHGTFFEMLGNFSFGDYFKKEATAWAWEFITQDLKIPVDRIWVTVYLEDDEAAEIWANEVGVDPSRIVRLGKADNFWEIGSGPCGPSSEIYYDYGPERSCGKPDCAVGCDCDRYVEFWNLVFTQFNNDGNGNYTPLAQKNIDTGMGLERLACIMQGVDNLFEVDTIQNIMKHVAAIAGVTYKQDEKTDVSLRVITDHIRSTTMLVSDGVLPSNEGRGYVLRRLLRRAARHGKLIGIDRPFLAEVCETVIQESGKAYPELVEKRDYIKKVIAIEEERFQQTIDSGMKLLTDQIEKTKAAGSEVFSGAEAFRLNDTYGFPVDLTDEILEENGLTLDRAEFDKLLSEQKERARAARTALGNLGWVSVDLGLDKDIKTEFTGYTRFADEGSILAIVCDGELQSEAIAGQKVSVVLDKTPFYAESGGQASDYGTLTKDGAKIDITGVHKTNDGKYVHAGIVAEGSFRLGDRVKAEIDIDRREAMMRAHSTTHLLQKALRNTLGTHVEQAGSQVLPDELRFDFTHFNAMTSEELFEVEREVNKMLLAGLEVTTTEMPIDEAKKLGAMALFGEKYGDVVRVVKMGDYSTELCGGTHLSNTARAGLFKIKSESSVAAGVRRIEGITGVAVLREYDMKTKVIGAVGEALKASSGDVAAKARQTAEELRAAKREAEKLRGQKALSEIGKFLENAKTVKGIKVIAENFAGADVQTLRQMGDWLRDKEPAVTALLSSTDDEGKITFLAVSGKDAQAKGIKAGALVKEASTIAGGSGGGKPDSAMGGGKDTSALKAALDCAAPFVEANSK